MIYDFKDGSPTNVLKLDAQQVGEELERLRIAHDGTLVKEDILESAQSPDSPLHGAFLWDDIHAARQFRLNQARQLVRAIVVVDEEGGEDVRAFWPVRATVSGSDEIDSKDKVVRYYQSARVIHQNPQEYGSALKMALMELESAETTLQQLKRIAPDKEHSRIQKAADHLLDAHDVLYRSPSVTV